jgi:predicted oxidoreductase
MIRLAEDSYLWVTQTNIMESSRTIENVNEISMDQIIACIRNARNHQIDELMKESVLIAFLEHYYDTVVISNVKKAFLFKDLGELKFSSLDLAHYSSLITRMKETKSQSIDGHNPLFLVELKNVFQKHISKK